MQPDPRPRPEAPRFPGPFQAFLLVVALLMAEWLASAALRDAQGLLGLNRGQRLAMAVLLGNALVFAVVMQITGSGYRTLFHDTSTPRRALLLLVVPPVLLLVPALVLVGALASAATQRLFGLSSWEESAFGLLAQPGLGVVAMVCVLAPVLEEMLFRGIVLRGFLTRYPRRVAIAASAIVFGFAHFNIHQFVVAFLLGLLLGWLYERTRSLLPGIALHAGYNSAVTVLANQPTDDPAGGAALMAWIGLSVLAGVPAWLALRRMLRSAAH